MYNGVSESGSESKLDFPRFFKEEKRKRWRCRLRECIVITGAIHNKNELL